MKRLTYRLCDKDGRPCNKVIIESHLIRESEAEQKKILLSRLAEYEDLGFTPSELKRRLRLNSKRRDVRG